MKLRTKRMKVVSLVAVIAGAGIVGGAAGAFGSASVPSPTLPRIVSWGSDEPDHDVVTEDRQLPGIDPEAAPPEVDQLWADYLEAKACLEAEGFGFLGPVPLSDGSGLQYLVSSPDGGPTLAPSNGCEDPLKSGAAAFSRAASPEARQTLVDEFRATMRCLGLDDDQVEAGIDGAELARNLDAEQQVMSELMASAEANDRCAGRPS